MGSQNNMNLPFNQILKPVQESPELLLYIDISVSIAEILTPLFSMLVADKFDAELFCPVNGIEHQRFAGPILPYILDLIQ